MRRSSIILHGAVVSICVLLSCAPMNIAGGGNSSGTGNGAIAYAVSDRVGGVTGPKATVLLYSKDWMPLSDSGTYADSTVTDTGGVFSFVNVPHGYYNLIIFAAGERGAGIFKNIPCQASVTWADTIDTLGGPGFLRGFAVAQNDTLALSYVYVKGTPFHAMTDSIGKFLMGPLPPSGYTLQLFGLYTTSAGGPVKAVPDELVQGTHVGAITDSLPVIIYPDSIVQFKR
jgi:hypothetical protein